MIVVAANLARRRQARGLKLNLPEAAVTHTITAGRDAHTGISLTATVLGAAGLVLRSLSNSTEELNRLLGNATALLRKRWYGQEPLNLRKS
jgi:urease gamma subunit